MVVFLCGDLRPLPWLLRFRIPRAERPPFGAADHQAATFAAGASHHRMHPNGAVQGAPFVKCALVV